MTEPNYIYVRGTGWVVQTGPYILTAEDCKGEWFKYPKVNDWDNFSYPMICKNFKHFERVEGAYLKVGDIVPFGDSEVNVITKINRDTIVVNRYFKDGSVYTGIVRDIPSAYLDVCRP